jgi:hypothetical protein
MTHVTGARNFRTPPAPPRFPRGDLNRLRRAGRRSVEIVI